MHFPFQLGPRYELGGSSVENKQTSHDTAQWREIIGLVGVFKSKGASMGAVRLSHFIGTWNVPSCELGRL